VRHATLRKLRGMPIGQDIAWTLYAIFLVVALTITLAVILIRLMLAATRALNAYTDDRKLRRALVLDEFDPVDETRAN
jgi:hypothetical protein